jgi:hypothetical protein
MVGGEQIQGHRCGRRVTLRPGWSAMTRRGQEMMSDTVDSNGGELLTKKSNTPAWEICLALVQVQRLVRCERASQFDPATDKICK